MRKHKNPAVHRRNVCVRCVKSGWGRGEDSSRTVQKRACVRARARNNSVKSGPTAEGGQPWYGGPKRGASRYIFHGPPLLLLPLLLLRVATRTLGLAPVRVHTAVLWVCMRTFFTLPFRESVGDVPLNPGFCMPRPLLPLAGRGFFRLDRNGLRIADGVIDDPFELSVVVIDIVLPLGAPSVAYGRPLASVTDTVLEPPPGKRVGKQE